jgi:hypothetical protein
MLNISKYEDFCLLKIWRRINSQLFPNVSEDPTVSFFEVNGSDPQEATIGDIRKGKRRQGLRAIQYKLHKYVKFCCAVKRSTCKWEESTGDCHSFALNVSLRSASVFPRPVSPRGSYICSSESSKSLVCKTDLRKTSWLVRHAGTELSMVLLEKSPGRTDVAK